ncbi:hypothetical protein BLNAU_19472 [Blattamonas nauphoetae]|uniref:Uncharacterized protein n=1 Tax=Blattamonas nauphoetae TaxID=2049346 RepID=A0ABQ9X1F7_9EUKA|nr:hypothetical protein BLNAU_19472 [Blattamonas nauphoetae]
MLTNATNDAQTLLVLSAPSIRQNRDVVYPTLNDPNSDLLLRLAERRDNLDLAAAVWKWIACQTKLVKMQPLTRKVIGVMEPNKQMTALILRTLDEMCSRLRKG